MNARPLDTISRRKLWMFRLLAAVGVPLFLFAILELGLRVAGIGHPTSFLLSSDDYAQPTLVENAHFGWRFFGPELSRDPATFAIPDAKPDDTVRVFVFGESAAFGDPQPDYGLARMLHVVLSMRRPDLRFEVVNAAMTGINSHVIHEIADDCAANDGDIWVIYMGNNEVVGPYGAGTIFGAQTPPLSLVRANLFLKTMRTGQFVNDSLRSLASGRGGPRNWGGMEMFMRNQVAADDPRMERVYRHYRRNLEDMIDLGRRNGAGVVVSTVAVNLRDCAPFASDFSRPLTTEERATWDRLYAEGLDAHEAGRAADAVKLFDQAAAIDERVANLQYCWGRSLLKSDGLAEAREHLELARDLDCLRFRCDSRMHSIVREVAANRQEDGVRLVDAAEVFHQESPSSISGREQFYEHVHLTFAGNHLLARLVADEVEALLPPFSQPGEAAATEQGPTLDECAERLAWTDVAYQPVLAELLGRLREPPFTMRLDHAEQMRALADEFQHVATANQTNQLQLAVEQCRRAIDAWPDDSALHSQLALLLGQAGDLEGAYHAALRASQLLPHDGAKRYQLGLVLGILGRDEQAVEAFRAAFIRSANDVWAPYELAKTLLRLKREDEALETLEQTVAINPQFGPAYLVTGLILEQRGRLEEAEANFKQAVQNRVRIPAELITLAQFCHSKGWYEDAVTSYRDALGMNPTSSALHLGIARSLAALKQDTAAEKHYREAIHLAPQSAQARYEFGVYLAQREDHAGAAEQFAQAAELDPTLLRARIDYGMALIAIERLPEALEQFKLVLARDPDNAIATEYKAAIEQELQH